MTDNSFLNIRTAKLVSNYWDIVRIQSDSQSETLKDTLVHLRSAIFDYKEFSRAECMIDGICQRFNCKGLLLW